MAGRSLRNLVRSAVLVLGMVGLLLSLGWFFAGIYGIAWALCVGIIPLVASIRIYPALVLKMYRARPLAAAESPQLHAIIRELARRADLDTVPRLHYIPSTAPLVFSIGSGSNAAIAVSDGILRLLTLRELVGVLGHEMSHIGSGDTWVMSFADVVNRLTRLISLLGQLLVLINLPLFILGEYAMPWVPIILMMFAPTVSALLQLSLSRTREYEADLSGARLSGDPAGLASALAKLEAHQQRLLKRALIPGRTTVEPSLLRTHPVTDERIRRLAEVEHELYPDREPLTGADGEGGTLAPHLEEVTRRPRRHLSGLWH
ncbi:zinc metalloprotease HtpX [Geobacter pickeringii]|uniref:Peptidase M48 n=1 Tax=Geobacter pickeringii TaxID=345632 RepID=A0A0B5BGW1_9BACT|nr:zinc metalloprotease HtpX [Geobacter pickeringii]AJE03750.1 peptidase M48 [Geobacter pickeringii]